jgi:DNA-binding MarR family transcriptional regulator
LAEEVVGLYFQVLGRMRAHMEKVASDFGLSFQQAVAVIHLDTPMAMGHLAEHLHCDASYVTGITDRLEERHLVERQVDPSDRRCRLLVLTDEGATLRRQLMDRALQSAPLTAHLSENQQRSLRSILRRAAQNQ